MEGMLRKLFPQTKVANRRRAGANELEIYIGRFHWLSHGTEVSHAAHLEPPTDARPNESRVTRVHEYDCFTIKPPEEGSGRLLVIFIQKLDDSVWPFVITEQSLEHEDWNPAVADFLLSAINADRRKGNAAYGFVDFTTGQKLVR